MLPSEKQGENRKSFLLNDRLLVCSMLVFYSLCALGFILATVWWLNTRTQMVTAAATQTRVSQNIRSTATAEAFATQKAISTGTAIARATEHGNYKFIDHFDSNASRWAAGDQDNEYWVGTTYIRDGVYTWDVNRVKKTFVWWSDFHRGVVMDDFDVYLDVKFVEGSGGDVCGGLVFRKSSKGWQHGAYFFKICNDSTYKIQYHGQDGWENVSTWKYEPAIQRTDWNRIEISARGDHFTFTINNLKIYEMDDGRSSEGGLAILIDIPDDNPAVIEFDNFGYSAY